MTIRRCIGRRGAGAASWRTPLRGRGRARQASLVSALADEGSSAGAGAACASFEGAPGSPPAHTEVRCSRARKLAFDAGLALTLIECDGVGARGDHKVAAGRKVAFDGCDGCTKHPLDAVACA